METSKRQSREEKSRTVGSGCRHRSPISEQKDSPCQRCERRKRGSRRRLRFDRLRYPNIVRTSFPREIPNYGVGNFSKIERRDLIKLAIKVKEPVGFELGSGRIMNIGTQRAMDVLPVRLPLARVA